jgi:hypothetical protein
MSPRSTTCSADDVIQELSRMRDLGYFVVEEAFAEARSFKGADLCSLSVTSLAFLACERGHAAYKSRLTAQKLGMIN